MILPCIFRNSPQCTCTWYWVSHTMVFGYISISFDYMNLWTLLHCTKIWPASLLILVPSFQEHLAFILACFHNIQGSITYGKQHKAGKLACSQYAQVFFLLYCTFLSIQLGQFYILRTIIAGLVGSNCISNFLVSFDWNVLVYKKLCMKPVVIFHSMTAFVVGHIMLLTKYAHTADCSQKYGKKT